MPRKRKKVKFQSTEPSEQKTSEEKTSEDTGNIIWWHSNNWIIILIIDKSTKKKPVSRAKPKINALKSKGNC